MQKHTLKMDLNMKLSKNMKRFWMLFGILAAIAVLLFIYVVAVNYYVKSSSEDRIVQQDEIEGEFDCIFVLGCGVWEDGTPSHMLRDRLDTALSLYESGAAPFILVSGDNSRVDYDEVTVMKNYLVDKGVPEEVVYKDHAGFSTYESVYRAKAIFGVERMIIVTQGYHLYRSLYLADDRGIDAVGVDATVREYYGQAGRDLREIVARNKDFLYCIFDPKPTYLGQTIEMK